MILSLSLGDTTGLLNVIQTESSIHCFCWSWGSFLVVTVYDFFKWCSKTVDRNWRWREIAIHRIEYHSTNPIHAYRRRTPGLTIGSKWVCCARDCYPISSTICVLGSYRSIRPSYTKWHWVGHVYCIRTRCILNTTEVPFCSYTHCIICVWKL
jgi:hypothetical protein